jgi:hypothetical protein
MDLSGSSFSSEIGSLLCVTLVTSELWANTVESDVSVLFWFSDTVLVGLLVLVGVCVVLGFGHLFFFPKVQSRFCPSPLPDFTPSTHKTSLRLLDRTTYNQIIEA